MLLQKKKKKEKKEKGKSDVRQERNKEKNAFKILFMYLNVGGAGWGVGCQMSEGLIRKQRPH